MPEANTDVIVLTGVDTLSAAFSGAYVLSENYLYTVEAFQEYFDHLTPGGMLTVNTGHMLFDLPNTVSG